MTYHSGKDGTLTCNGSRVAKVSNWTLSANVETMETTTLTESDRSFVPGLRGYSGSATIFYYDDAPRPLLERVVGVSPVNESDIFKIRLGWGAKYIEGQCIITSGELSCAVGEVMQSSIQFQFTGPLVGAVL
jgi:hypothetical protein